MNASIAHTTVILASSMNAAIALGAVPLDFAMGAREAFLTKVLDLAMWARTAYSAFVGSSAVLTTLECLFPIASLRGQSGLMISKATLFLQQSPMMFAPNLDISILGVKLLEPSNQRFEELQGRLHLAIS